MKKMNRFLALLLAASMVLTLAPVGAQAAGTGKVSESLNTNVAQTNQTGSELVSPYSELGQIIENEKAQMAQESSVSIEKIDVPDTQLSSGGAETIELEAYAEDEIVRIIVVMEQEGLLGQGFTTAQIAENGAQISAASAKLQSAQDKLITSLKTVSSEEITVKYTYDVTFSGVAIEAPYRVLAQVRQLPNVELAYVAPSFSVPEDMTTNSVEADPNMFATGDIVGSTQTWQELGYTGTGMRIAVVDTGLDLDHHAFAEVPELTDTSLTVEEIESVLTSLNAYEMYNANNTVALEADRLYHSGKVPYGFNYVDRNLDVTHDNDLQGDHGTHVAGIAAANAVDDSPVVGVAPDAQVLVMKVFGAAGGAYMDDILAALEDCFRLNVDAVNMSLGSPAGFSEDWEAHYNEVYGSICDTDMIVSVSAGNSTSAALMNGWGNDMNLTSDPDVGVVSSPASYAGTTSVASLENNMLMFKYFTVAGEALYYNDVASMPFTGLHTEEQDTYEYVMIPGVGDVSDYEGLDVNGKIAVISRGSIDFTSKQTNAADAGAIAAIVCDNVESSEIINMMDAGVIPNVFVTKAVGDFLAANAVEGVGTLTVHAADDTIAVESPLAGTMSTFSSIGVSPDLTLEPDITAPGGNIYSTLDNDTYGTMSGTSMSAPHIAGMSAPVLQYLRNEYDLDAADAHTIGEALLMSTAQPVTEASGEYYTPRKQGAGSANIYNAIVSPAYLTVDGSTPKVSFGDDDDKNGVYTFSFELNNFGTETQVYELDASVMTDLVDTSLGAYGYYFMTESSLGLGADVRFDVETQSFTSEIYDVNGDGICDLVDVQLLLDAVNGLDTVAAEKVAEFELTGDGVVDTADVQKLYEMVTLGLTDQDMVQVAPGETVTIHATITLTEDDKAYMDAYYPNGIYVDGFVRLYAATEGGVDLSLPFMGFYGDWSDARVFDSGWYYADNVPLYDANGGMYNADGSPFYERYLNVFFTNYGSSEAYLGMNPYAEDEFDWSHLVLSPDASEGYGDYISEIYVGMMRNALKMTYTWTDEDGNILHQEVADMVNKSYYNVAYGLCIPSMYSSYAYEIYDYAGTENGDVITLTIDAWLDDGDDIVDDSYAIDIHIDNEAPVVVEDSLALLYDEKTDTRMLKFDVTDNHSIATVVALTNTGDVIEYFPVDGTEGTVTVDVTEYDASFQIAVCDFGFNESYYQIDFAGRENVSYDSFYSYRRYSVIPNGTYLYATDGLNGWYSFENAEDQLQHTDQYGFGETAVMAAEYVDGYIVGVDVNGDIFGMKAGTWDRNYFGSMPTGIDADGIETAIPALDMTLDINTGILYILSDELYAGQGGHLMTLNYLTGEVTDLGVVTGIDSETAQGVTLACDNDGVLYTIDYSTGDLYTIDPETCAATYVGSTGYVPQNNQSMTVDHETNTLYWAAYQGYTGNSAFYIVDKTTAQLTYVSGVEYNGAMVGLMKPFRADVLPDNAELTGLKLSKDRLLLSVGKTAELKCMAEPYYAQLDQVVWASSDETVATVSDGVVAAVAAGQAVITASVGELSVTCDVTVSEFSGKLVAFDMGNSYSWLSLDAADPTQAETVVSGQPTYNGFVGAVYHDGWIYASEYGGGFYQLDPSTLQGVRLGSSSTLMGLTMNYADGYMYGNEYVASFWSAENYLARVNPATGEVKRLGLMDMETFGTIMAGPAADYEGNFYVIAIDSLTYETNLVKFRLTENDEFEILETASLAEWGTYNYGSLTYSHENGGLFWANDVGNLLWIGTEDLSDLKVMDLGVIGATGEYGYAMTMGLTYVMDNEPAGPDVEPESVTISDSYLMLEGGTINVGLSVEPWNAKVSAAYSTLDPSVATVDSFGNITGVSAGETSLGVYVDALGEILEAPVTVVESAGYLNGFLISDFAYGSNIWVKFSDTDPVNDLAATSDAINIAAHSGAYYNGKLYTFGQDQTGDLDYKNYLQVVDPATYESEVISLVNYTLRDMAFDYTTGTMLAIATGGTVKGALAQVDLETGAVVTIGDTGMTLASMTVDAEGNVYAIGEDTNLYRLDKTTGEAELIGSTGVNDVALFQSMHFDLNTGNTYWAQVAGDQTSSLRLVDLTTGSTTSLGTISQSGAMIGSMYTVPENEPAVPETMEPTGIRLYNKATVAVGGQTTLNALVLPVTVSEMDETLTWVSSDESVATVADGVVTGVAEGTVTVTATTVNGVSAECEVLVTAEARKFYVYDETNTQWISFTGEDTGNVTVERDDAEGETVIKASAYNGEVLYSYDETGAFYSIDADTFERTYVGAGISDDTYTLEAYDWWTGETIPVECELRVVDMSYDAATGKTYVALIAANDDQWLYSAVIGEVDVATGEVTYVFESAEVQPGNLLVVDGTAFFVDTYMSGMLCVADLSAGDNSYAQQSLTQGYWGDYSGGRGFIYDDLTDTVYAIRDNQYGTSVLNTYYLADAHIVPMGEISASIIANSLFIK